MPSPAPGCSSHPCLFASDFTVQSPPTPVDSGLPHDPLPEYWISVAMSRCRDVDSSSHRGSPEACSSEFGVMAPGVINAGLCYCPPPSPTGVASWPQCGCHSSKHHILTQTRSNRDKHRQKKRDLLRSKRMVILGKPLAEFPYAPWQVWSMARPDYAGSWIIKPFGRRSELSSAAWSSRLGCGAGRIPARGGPSPLLTHFQPLLLGTGWVALPHPCEAGRGRVASGSVKYEPRNECHSQERPQGRVSDAGAELKPPPACTPRFGG